MNKLLIALMTAAFAASPAYVAAQTTAPAKEEKKAEAKKEAAPMKAETKKGEPKKDEKKGEPKKDEKKKPKGGC